MSNWNNIAAIVQGDFSYEVNTKSIYNDYIEMVVTCYSEKWDTVDLSFEYFNYGEWMKDANVVISSGRIEGNKILGLSASKYGSENIIVWKFTNNNLRYGSETAIRFSVLPQTRVFSESIEYSNITELSGENRADSTDGSSEHKCVSYGQAHQAICLSGDSLIIKESAASPEVLYEYHWLLYPSHAIQINNGGYIVADTGSNRIIELSEDLSTVVKEVSIGSPVYVDYSESQNTVLITTNDYIYQMTWADWEYGSITWQSSYSLNTPKSATYKQDDYGKMAIADTGNNSVVKYATDSNSYSTIENYQISKEDILATDQTSLYRPLKAFWLSDGNISIVEQSGSELSL